MKLGVFVPNWIGDAAMATPALRALRRRFGPNARIVGIMRPHMDDLLAGTGLVDECLPYDPRSRERELRSWTLVKRLRRNRLDVAVLFTNTMRTALLAAAAGIRHRVGYARHGRRLLLTQRLEPPRGPDGKIPDHRMVDYYLKLAYAMGCPPESPHIELATTESDERAADRVWSGLGLRSGRVVAFNSSGAFGAAKLWPPEYFAELARRVAAELDHDVLVICGPNERDLARVICRQAGHLRVKSLADEPPSVGLSKACVRRSRMFVTTDSGPRQFAVAFDVPIVSMYGPTAPIWGGNPTARETTLHVDLDCFGCQQRTCPLGHHRCMRDLGVDRVFAAVSNQLNRPGRFRRSIEPRSITAIFHESFLSLD